MLAAAILAAGESRRMGSPKALLDYRGKTFLEHLIDVTRHPRVGVLRVVLGAKAGEIRARVALEDPAIVINEQWPSGQLSSIHAAIRSLPRQTAKTAKTAQTEESARTEGTDGLMLCPVDHPIVSRELIAQIIAAFDASGKSIVVPVYKERRGHPVIFRACLYGELLAASPAVGAREIVRAHPDAICEVPTTEEGVVLNLDDPQSYERAMQSLR
jgi:CTP:molybdopterin cytidylyltransferase MocA